MSFSNNCLKLKSFKDKCNIIHEIKYDYSLVEFIKGINYQNKYTAIFETLSLLQDEIFKNIDDVTIL